MTSKLLCVAILGPVMLLMGTTISGMVAYVLGCACVGVWQTSRLPRVAEAVSMPAPGVRQAEEVDELQATIGYQVYT